MADGEQVAVDALQRTAGKALGEIALAVLRAAPGGALPHDIVEALATPKLATLQSAGAALMAGGHFAAAAVLYAALRDWPGRHVWVHAGAARAAMARQDWQAATEAWRFCLDTFPEQVVPGWLAELARAEMRLGQDAEAEALLRLCRERFPDYVPAASALANLLHRTGRYEMAIETWAGMLRDFPDQAVPAWQTGTAACLRALGRTVEAETVLDEMAARFPGSAAALARLANAAAAREDWGEALRRWTECVETHAQALQPAWLNGRALALMRLNRLDEAINELDGAIRRFPDFVSARLRLAEAAQETGRLDLVRECFAGLIARFPDQVTPSWLAGEARALLFTGRYDEAALAIEALDRRFADSPAGCRLALDFCFVTGAGLNGLSARLDEGLRRFPGDRVLLAEHVRVLLATSRPDEADAITRRLEAEENDHHALISRWRVDMDRDGEAAIKERVVAAVARRAFTANAAAVIASFLLAVWSVWPQALAEEVLRGALAGFPSHFALRRIYAKALIAMRRDDAALAVIDGLPAAAQTQDVLELRAWAQWRRGALETAQETWRTMLSRYHFPAVNGPAPVLELISRGLETHADSGVTTFVNIKNEMLHLPEFLRHHRGIGVRRFVFVDNMSADAGPAFLAAQPDVILYRTSEDFQTSNAGMRWVNTLRERHGGGGWCLYADADEAFTYPGWEAMKLDQLTAYLDEEGSDALWAFMLDVYPARLADAAGMPAPASEYRFYDANYEWMGQFRPPYVQPVGGVRGRLFHVNETLHKTPLLRHGRGVYINSHGTTPVRLSGVTGIMLHYKLMNLVERYRPAVPGIGGNPFMADRPPDLMRRHARYAARMAELLEADLHVPEISVDLPDSLTLVARGLMQAPPGFWDWLDGAQAR